MYENRRSPPVPRTRFLARLSIHLAVAALVVGGSLAVGMLGYGYFEGLGWRDAFLNAAMLLGGMGPVETPQTPNGKLFAGLYAMYAGLVFLVVLGIVFAPLIHRFLHRFHWEDGGADQNSES